MTSSRVAIIILCMTLQLMQPGSAADNELKQFRTQVQRLGDEQPAVRDKAAAVIRELLTKSAGALPDAHAESYWAKLLQSITIGMSKTDVDKIIPNNADTQPTVGRLWWNPDGTKQNEVRYKMGKVVPADGGIIAPQPIR